MTVISPERPSPLPHVDVEIRDGRITRIGAGLAASPGARVIEGRGGYLVPGLIDSHVHVGHQGPLDDDAIDKHSGLLASWRAQVGRSFLAHGFTTLVDLDLASDTRGWFEAAPIHPRLYGCGRAVRVAGGYAGAQRVPADPETAAALNLVYEPAQHDLWPAAIPPGDFTPERAVARAADTGAICLKTFIEPGFGGAAHWPVPRAETLAALRDAARGRGLVFIVHANAVEAWRAAIEAGAGVIAHGLWHWPGDRMNTTPPPEAGAVIAAAARAGVAVQPTLQAVYGDETIFDASLLDDPRLAEALPGDVLAHLRGPEAQAARQALADEYRGAIAHWLGPAADPAQVMAVAPERAARTLRIMTERKVRLLFGSDTPSNEGIGNPPGLNGRFEMQRWFEAGVPPAAILRAATLANAEAFGLAREIGSIEVGKRADLLLLRSDPLQDIDAWDTIETVVLQGEPMPRGSLVASGVSPPR
ncbi:MAG TPA: amidohydrolase family protein [Candidatus Polarisedimenticolia bacterium]|nr:amidohydrolase family protein [Candidatus Polarisedimenticolia bacterium]